MSPEPISAHKRVSGVVLTYAYPKGVSADSNAVRLARVAADAALDKKATDVVAVDVSGVLVITDVFVVCSAANSRQVRAVVDEVEKAVRLAGGDPCRREGLRDASWVLLDFGEIVVHVQLEQERVNYGLERLWQDCPEVDLDISEHVS